MDLDNLWSYLKTHGDPNWQAFPTYLDALADVVLPLLEARALRITFFIVGQDAELPQSKHALEAITAAGHEIGNHSFHHEQWLHLRARGELDAELERAEAAIEAATGIRPKGFRGPGYSLSAQVLAVLAERGYLYDATTFPTFIGPLARAYYFRRSPALSQADRANRARLFGRLGEGWRPLKPYTWEANGRQLAEIPVTTVPVVRLPFHQSYLLYLSTFSRTMAIAYLKAALALCRATGIRPSFVLHPLDFLGADRVGQLGFFPGMTLSTRFKVEFFEDVIGILQRSYRLVTVEEHVNFETRTWQGANRARWKVYAS